MAKKKVRAAKTGPVWHQTSEQATLAKMPKYNGFACGTGPQGSTKYNRAKVNRQTVKELRSGSFDFMAATWGLSTVV